MKKMYLFGILIIILIIIAGFIAKNKFLSPPKNSTLDKTVAKRYVASWSSKVNGDMKSLQESENGNFVGQVGSLGFEFNNASHILIVRANLFPYSDSFNAKTDLLPWLNDIAAKDPQSVSGGYFESIKGPWEPEKETSLFLHVDVANGALTDQQFISIMEKLRSDALVWRRSRLTDALDSLVKERKSKIK